MEVSNLKRLMFILLILIFAVLSVSGCSQNNNAGPSASGYGSGTLPGTTVQSTDRIKNELLPPGSTLNPLLSPASTF